MFDINDADTKKAVKEAIESAVAEATEGLKAKNAELLGKLKKATKDAAIDPAEYQAVQAELEQTQAKLAEAQKIAKTAAKEAESAKKALEGEAGFVSKLLVDNGLNDALLKAGVKPEMTKAVKALLSGQVSIKIDGDKRDAVIGDKSLSDFVSEWAKSDEGKHFVAAPANQGGGAPGGAGKGGNVKSLTRTAFDGLDVAAKSKFIADGGTVTDAAA